MIAKFDQSAGGLMARCWLCHGATEATPFMMESAAASSALAEVK
jgi:hypothetical protein